MAISIIFSLNHVHFIAHSFLNRALIYKVSPCQTPKYLCLSTIMEYLIGAEQVLERSFLYLGFKSWLEMCCVS